MPYRAMRKIYFEKGAKEALQEYDNRLNSPCCLKIGMDIAGYSAFVLTTPEIINLIEGIYRHDRRLISLKLRLPDVAFERYVNNALAEEIIQTNEIENVHSTKRDIHETIEGLCKPSSETMQLKFRDMVLKYQTVLNGESDIPVTCGDVRTIYDELMLDEIRSEDETDIPDGQIFRKGPVSVFDAHDVKIHNGIFPEKEIISRMEIALRFLNNEEISPLVRAAVFHYLFAYIHPFYNGNGRMARYLTVAQLSKNFCPFAMLKLSYVIRHNRSNYFKAFKETDDKRNYGDLTDFVTVFLKFILDAMEDCDTFLTTACESYNRYWKLIQDKEKFKRYKNVLNVLLQNALFEDEGISLHDLAEAVELTSPTVEAHIRRCNSLSNCIAVTKDGNKNLYRLNPDLLLDCED